MLKNYFLTSLCFIFLSHLGYTSGVETISAHALKEMHRFDFHRADSLAQILERHHPNHFLTHFTRANYNWWLIITHPRDGNLERAYLSSLNNALEAIEKSSGSNMAGNKLFWVINIYAFKARLDLMNHNFLKAIRHMDKCIGYINKSMGHEQKYPNLYLTSGLYNFLSAYGALKYPFLRPYTIFYPKGDMDKGIQQLYAATENANPVINTEAHYFLMRIYLDLKRDLSKASYHAGWLTVHYPENLIFLYYAHKIKVELMKNYRAEELKERYMYLLGRNNQLNPIQKRHLTEMITLSNN